MIQNIVVVKDELNFRKVIMVYPNVMKSIKVNTLFSLNTRVLKTKV